MTARSFHRLCLVALRRSLSPSSPLWRDKDVKGRGLLAGAIALFLLGVGGGTYWMLGQPYLALALRPGRADPRHQRPDRASDQARAPAPGDLQAWVYLGRGLYGRGRCRRCRQGLCPRRDARQSQRPSRCRLWMRSMAKRWWRGERRRERRSGGRLPRRAEARSARTRRRAFSWARRWPRMATSRARWRCGNSLLAEAPANSPLHQALVDRIAMLTAQGGGRRARSQGDGGDAGGAAEGQSQ